MKTAKVHEIFTSIQGEGIFSGKRQVFVRFFGCNIGCVFCDTVQSPQDVKDYSADDLLSAVNIQAMPKSVHSVSLTGGEPLLQADFLREFLPKLKQQGYKTYLETNGVLPAELLKVIDYIDIIAMDIKLPSSTETRPFWNEHSQFLKFSMREQIFVKIIVTAKTAAADFTKAVLLIAQSDPHIALVIQPVTPSPTVDAAGSDALKRFKDIASEHLNNVRIIPQMHKLYGIK